MKKVMIVLGALVLAAYFGGCGNSNGRPSRSLIESEFRHAWYAIHGEMGDKGFRWRLEKLKVGDVLMEPPGNVARATITYTYEAYGRSVTKTVKFKYLKIGNTWQIEDRDGQDNSSTTRYNMTP